MHLGARRTVGKVVWERLANPPPKREVGFDPPPTMSAHEGRPPGLPVQPCSRPTAPPRDAHLPRRGQSSRRCGGGGPTCWTWRGWRGTAAIPMFSGVRWVEGWPLWGWGLVGGPDHPTPFFARIPEPKKLCSGAVRRAKEQIALFLKFWIICSFCHAS